MEQPAASEWDRSNASTQRAGSSAEPATVESSNDTTGMK